MPDATDIVVTGGVLTDFALKANETKIYIATFTPTNSATAGTISICISGVCNIGVKGNAYCNF
jgi:hypothetical protein